jgi:hypothetical protein
MMVQLESGSGDLNQLRRLAGLDRYEDRALARRSRAQASYSVEFRGLFLQNEPNFLTLSQSVGCRARVEFIDENGGGPGVRLRKTPKPKR